tara:strand:+ start:52 stop:1215 length:1164 start_codon:yes stop_codon:yes gene_type:complete
MLISRKGRKEASPVGTVVILTLLAGFLLFILSLPEIDRQELLDSIETGEGDIVMDVVPGDVEAKTSTSSSKVYTIENFKLDSDVHSIDSVLASDFDLSSNVFKKDSKTYSFVPDWDASTIGMSLNAFIQNYAGNGELTILLNGNSIYSAEPVVGNFLNVDLPATAMYKGNNNLEIVWDKKGSNIFTSAKIGLDNVLLRTDTEGQDLNQDFTFSVSSGEVVSATLNSVIRRNSATTTPLTIELNGDTIYNQVPLSTILTLRMPSESINSGSNILSFSIGQRSVYEILFSDLIVKTKKKEGGEEYFFRLSDVQARNIVKGRSNCLLEVVKSGGDSDEVTIDINGFTNTYSVRPNKVSFNVCNYLVYGGNTISFASDDELVLSSAKLILT